MKVVIQSCFEAVMCLIPNLNLIKFDFQLLELFPSLHCFKGLSAGYQQRCRQYNRPSLLKEKSMIYFFLVSQYKTDFEFLLKLLPKYFPVSSVWRQECNGDSNKSLPVVFSVFSFSSSQRAVFTLLTFASHSHPPSSWFYSEVGYGAFDLLLSYYCDLHSRFLNV